MDLFTRFEIIVMTSVVGSLVMIILLLSLLEIISRRKEKKKDNNIDNNGGGNSDKKDEEIEVLDLNQEVTPEPKEEVNEPIPALISNQMPTINVVNIEPSLVKINDIKEEEVEELDLDKEDEVLVTKIEPVENLEIETQEQARVELERLENELEHEPSLEDTITSIEAMEEESAIISYQELLSTTSKIEGLPLDDDGDEPISINELYERYNTESELPKIEANFNINDFEKSLPIGSETESLSEIQLENTANLEKLDKEIRKTNEFLHMLNELKKNLD